MWSDNKRMRKSVVTLHLAQSVGNFIDLSGGFHGNHGGHGEEWAQTSGSPDSTSFGSADVSSYPFVTPNAALSNPGWDDP
jgi:hypothetical protein